MEARREGEVSKGTEAQAEGKEEKGVHEGQREERKGRGREEGRVWVEESLRDEPLTCWGVLYTRKECPPE